MSTRVDRKRMVNNQSIVGRRAAIDDNGFEEQWRVLKNLMEKIYVDSLDPGAGGISREEWTDSFVIIGKEF